MVSIRRATMEDLLSMQNTNLWCLPENYQFKYFAYHGILWQPLLHVAEDSKGRVVGYVLAKMNDDAQGDEKDKDIKHGHITSLAVLRTHRNLGLATRLMQASQRDQLECFQAVYCSLHVRKSNKAAFHLYSETLSYLIHDKEIAYYADGEDAYSMRKWFTKDGQPPADYKMPKKKPLIDAD
ncbi:hypothetical protein BASA81_002685 [Batrachochytrium salamandrivorans]|nr:hypothetical protein BASA81_002685 [Batrachochytrium salamandrivorans]